MITQAFSSAHDLVAMDDGADGSLGVTGFCTAATNTSEEEAMLPSESAASTV